MSIMNKGLIHIVLFLWALPLFSQENRPEKVWKSESEKLKYEKADKYKGPDDWYGSYPADIKQEDNTSYGGSSHGIQYNPQHIKHDRRKRYGGYDRGGGNGTVKFDPKVQPPKPPDVPEVDPPDIDPPDLDLDAPKVNPMVWKVLMFLLIFAAVILIAYLLLKNRKPSNKKILVDVENDWNPEVISKSELELRLEDAIMKGDYRECVRIYFTFILKELIRKSWIRWKKDKTNYHYILEMRGKPNLHRFEECVRIYDLIWYGEYHIDETAYQAIEPALINYYKSLEPTNE